ncbi:hypothetical protein LguiB_013627 [Lonicera macranthoides]
MAESLLEVKNFNANAQIFGIDLIFLILNNDRIVKDTGDYRTVQEAIDAVPLCNTCRTVVRVSPEIYKQPVNVPKTKNLITLAGNFNYFNCFTDGPLLSPSSPGVNYFEKETKKRFQNGAITVQPVKLVPSPLSLSYLGPKFSRKRKNIKEELDENYLTLREMEQSLDGTILCILSSPKEEDYRTESKSFTDVKLLQKKFDQFTPEGRTLCGLPIRRSLVGSFKEYLLSGRLVSGMVSQKIDGFLAVLNITRGNFSPHPQKLPFAVTSVDGDNYLLYYSSIDLRGNNLSLNQCKGPKLNRSLSIGDSQADKSHLRIPMKGRIQLWKMIKRRRLCRHYLELLVNFAKLIKSELGGLQNAE